MITRLKLEYDGTDFYGWAAQPGQPSICAELERALAVVLRQEVKLVVAGRTDRGVHALGQVVSYEGPLPYLKSLNAVLPNSIVVTTANEAPEGFSARYDAISRTYKFRVHTRRQQSPFERGRALWYPHRHYVSLLQKCAEALHGVHDFTAFTPTQTLHSSFHRRVMSAEWVEYPEQGILEFWIEANAFMRHMNRVLVATMLEVASGRRGLDQFVRLLGGAPRSQAAVTARPHGLYLVSVRYEDG